MKGFIPSWNSLQHLFVPETISRISLETSNYSSIHRKAPGQHLRKYPTSFQIIATTLTVLDYHDIEFSCKIIITESWANVEAKSKLRTFQQNCNKDETLCNKQMRITKQKTLANKTDVHNETKNPGKQNRCA